MVDGLGHAYAVAGQHAEARAILAELTDLARRRYVTAYGIALVHVGLHDADRAFEWLERACDERSWWVMWLKVDPRLDPLRSDPRFKALLGRIGL